MSEETKAVEQEVEVIEAEATQEAPQPEVQESQQQQLSLADLKVGYIVGLTDEGNFVFEVFGKQKGLVELLGLHQHASARVKTLYDQTQKSGDALVNEVGRALGLLHQKVDVIQQAVAPKKPDNNL